MYETALSLLKEINDLGYEAYIVGGYPRDKYLGVSNSDIDICTSLSSELIEQYFLVKEGHPQYGSYVIEKNSYLFEITTFRKDHYNNNRYPEVEFVSTLQEDLQRRDFIINTLCINVEGDYVDLLGARKDIDDRMIRMIGDPFVRFKEDPLRIIRALRFAADLEFDLEEKLKETIIYHRELLTALSSSKMKKEIDKVKNDKNWNYWVQLLDLKSYLP